MNDNIEHCDWGNKFLFVNHILSTGAPQTKYSEMLYHYIELCKTAKQIKSLEEGIQRCSENQMAV